MQVNALSPIVFKLISGSLSRSGSLEYLMSREYVFIHSSFRIDSPIPTVILCSLFSS